MFLPKTTNDNNERSNSLESHCTDLDLPVFHEQSNVITNQPQLYIDSYESTIRRPIPVSTIDWQSTNVTQFIPMHGLEFLHGVAQLYIQQTVELNDLLSSVESENRYTVKIPQGETLYYATETSSSCHRMCFGSSRAFLMRLYDQTQQEALEFRRRLACGTCSFMLYLQSIEVWMPPGELIGIVKQKMCISAPLFFCYNRYYDIIFRIEGPPMCACMFLGKDAHFKIYSADGMTQVGSINHQWDQLQVAYNLSLHFPGRSMEAKNKAILLAAAFLIEYMYFETSKTSRCRC